MNFLLLIYIIFYKNIQKFYVFLCIISNFKSIWEKHSNSIFKDSLSQYTIYFFIQQNNTKYYSSYNQSLNFKLACNKYYLTLYLVV